MTDEERIAAYRNGDESAWEELYYKYKPIVLKIAHQFFLFGGDTEDLVQEGTFGLWAAVTGYNPQCGAFSGYAYSCIRNKMLDAVKKSNGVKNSALNNFLPLTALDNEAAVKGDPEKQLIKSEEKRELFEKLRSILSGFEFKVIQMYSDGKTMSQISESLGKNVKSVDNAVTRAKTKIHKYFSEG